MNKEKLIEMKELLKFLTNANEEMEKTMLVVKTNGTIARIRFEERPKLEDMQGIVGGYIEYAYVPALEEQGDYVVVVNEEGMIDDDVPVNYLMTELFGTLIFGNAIIYHKKYLKSVD